MRYALTLNVLRTLVIEVIHVLLVRDLFLSSCNASE